MPIRDGKIIGSMTMYYDPFIPCHHSGDHEAMIKLGPAQFILPYMPDDARILFDSGIEQLGWRRPGEIEMGDSQFNVFDSSYAMFLAKEFGDTTLHAKVKGFVEATSQPKWDEDRGEFWWGLRPGRAATARPDQCRSRDGGSQLLSGLDELVPGTHPAQVCRADNSRH